MSKEQTPPISVKTEPGVYKRLPSFRSPRDLKLSEFKHTTTTNSSSEPKNKKVYVPNLNIQRKKQAEDTVVNDVSKPEDKSKRLDDRPRGRGKRVPNLIQSVGVFSEGLAPNVKTVNRWTSRNSETSSSPAISKPVLGSSDKLKISKEEEDNVMKELLNDEFLDDPELEPDLSQCPIKLPILEFKNKISIKEEDCVIKKELQQVNGIKIKSEVVQEEIPIVEEMKEEKPVHLGEMMPLTISQLLEKSTDKSFIFLQLPNCMPGLNLNMENNLPTSVPNTAPTSSKGPKKLTETEEPEERCVLKTLPSGCIGTLQILKSGKARLVVGDAKMWVEPGTQTSFRQDLMSVSLDANTLTGNMINLGSLTTRMIISPDWESMLSKEQVK